MSESDRAKHLLQEIINAIENISVSVGSVGIDSIAAGDNNIGNVDIASALPAGNKIILFGEM